jgi:hypothetical protein
MGIPPIPHYKRQPKGQVVAIPDDWDQESWFCLQIQWPYSQKWIAVLMGLLTMPMQGRFWDRRTGTIVDAQAVGYEIFDRNVPFTGCEGETPPEPSNGNGGGAVTRPYGGGGAVCCCMEDYDMGCCITKLTIEDGVLIAWYGECCPVEIGYVTDIIPDVPDGDTQFPPEEEPPNNCRKAAAAAALVMAVCDAYIAEVDDIPPNIGDVHSQFPTISFYWPDSWLALFAAADLDVADDWTPYRDTIEVDLRCHWYQILADSAAAITDSEWDQMIDYALNGIGDLPGLLIRRAMGAIGHGDVSNAALGGLYDTDVNCDCPPGQTGELADITWRSSVTVSREDGTYTFEGRFDGGLTGRHKFVTKEGGSFNALGFAHAIDIPASTEITEMTLRFTPLQPSDELLHNAWHDPGATDCDTLADAQTNEIEASDRTELTVEVHAGKVYHRERWSVGKTALDWNNAELRACPRDVENKTYEFEISIISVNDVLTGLGTNPLD